jgi:uroporphyrinogen decarboxylase
MKKMNSRDRVLSALNHVQPDRVPSDYFGTPEIESALLKHFRVQTHDELLAALGTDIRNVMPDYVGPPLKKLADGSYEDIWGTIRTPLANEYGEYAEPSYQPFAKMQTLEEVEAHRWPSTDWYDYSTIVPQCRALEGYAICTGSFGFMDLINGIAYGRGVQQVLYDIATEDPVGLALMQRRAKFYLAFTERILAASKGKIELLLMGDDYGSQRGLTMNPKTWEKLFRPHMKNMIDLAHAYNCKVIHHSCGSTRVLFPRFIELGLDCLQTIQSQAWGMDPYELKALYGNRISFHGTIDVQGPLQRMTPVQVHAYVRERIEIVGKDGGFICSPSHNIQPDTPLENVLAMYQEIALG